MWSGIPAVAEDVLPSPRKLLSCPYFSFSISMLGVMLTGAAPALRALPQSPLLPFSALVSPPHLLSAVSPGALETQDHGHSQ